METIIKLTYKKLQLGVNNVEEPKYIVSMYWEMYE